MSAYLIFTRDETLDQHELDLYSKNVRATLNGHEFKILALYGKHEDLEGASTEGSVILEFPSIRRRALDHRRKHSRERRIEALSLKAESHRRRSDGDAMNQTLQERNKALVLEAFDTLFNKREYKAAEQYWSLNYIQHSAHIEPGREGRHRHGDLFPGTEEDDGASNIRRGPRSGGIVVPPSPSAFVSCS